MPGWCRHLVNCTKHVCVKLGLVCDTDEPVVYSNPVALIVGQSANLSCALSFGGPRMDATSPPDTQGMFPQLSMSLGPDRPLDLSSASLRHEPGEPASRRHQLSVVRTGPRLPRGCKDTHPHVCFQAGPRYSDCQHPCSETEQQKICKFVVNLSSTVWK